MKLTKISKEDFLEALYHETEAFLARIDSPEVFIVEKFYDGEEILNFRQQVFEKGTATDPSWHPLYDDCPDYHRIHDDYPKAHVKARMHAYYHHGWFEHNREVFDRFREIFDMKNYLAGFEPGHFITNTPSQHQVARVNLQNYPRGGGYIAEHIDPKSRFARLQTLVQASQIGVDYYSGGLFARETPKNDRFFVDEFTEIGDLMVLSPDIPHGLDPIDPEIELDWNRSDGRWIILPLILNSDYPSEENVKPREI
ncbi:MAG: hypothetical protein AAGA96_08565 [Verrucomicrobiota bacterium]